MNVTCPQCASVFRVDPAKVPESGVRARCSVCAGLIAVRRPPISAPVLPPIDIPLPPVDVRPTPPPVESHMAAPLASEPVVEPEPLFEAPPVEAPPVEVSPSEVSPPPAPEIMVRDVAAPVMPPAVPFTTLPPEPTPAVRPAAPTPAPDAEAPRAAPNRFANPFLQQDPATRARRLARALVSDLVVYHPEKRQRGLADGTLKELFSEEIRKSWEEYSEQVGQEIATTTPWFTEALNEILAEGRPLFG
ncbi:MAG: zinc-ribbon domain-containing protein [Gemmatimonadetes bacterium]|nr:zinc-ribbon domain-containing protein [Gemmatimonadota bacterium]